MKNLLNISLYIIIIVVVITSCKPVLVPKEIKEAYGTYSYEINDTVVVLKNTNDTIVYYLSSKTMNFELGFCAPEMEIIYLNFTDIYSTINSNPLMSLYIAGNQDVDFSIDFLFFNHIGVKDLLSELEIDGVSYDSVYYMQDEVAGYEMYSSKNYGFIKIWNDTISYKFVR